MTRITGTFLIDPSLPSPMANMSRHLRKKPDSTWGKTKGKKGKHHYEVNASFRTRHGRINLDLAVPSREPANASPYPGDKVPTRVYVSSQHGRISVNMVRPGTPSRH